MFNIEDNNNKNNITTLNGSYLPTNHFISNSIVRTTTAASAVATGPPQVPNVHAQFDHNQQHYPNAVPSALSAVSATATPTNYVTIPSNGYQNYPPNPHNPNTLNNHPNGIITNGITPSSSSSFAIPYGPIHQSHHYHHHYSQPPIPPPLPPPTPLHHHHNPYHHPPPPPPTYLQHQPYHYSPYQIQTAPAAAYAYHTIPAYGPYIQAAPPPHQHQQQHPQLAHPQSIQAHHHQHGVGYIPNNAPNSSTSIPAFISAMPPVVAPLASPTTLIAIQQPQMPPPLPVAQQPVTVVRSVPIMAPPPSPSAHSHNSKPQQQQQRPIAPGGGTNGNVSNNNNHQSGATSSSGAKSFSIDSSRRRRTRCKKCDSCLRADCGDCHFCKDMKKFGGPGRMKQSCIARQCLSPVLPHTACCVICGRDGWEKLTIDPALAPDDTSSSLMECSQCWEIVHPFCLNGKYPDLFKHNKGFMNKELPNSWECPKCVKSGNSTKVPQSSVSSSSTTSSSINRLSSSAVSTVSQSSSQAKSSSVLAHKSINWSLMTGAGAGGSKPSKEVVSNSGNKRLKSTDDFPPPPPTSSSSDDEVTSKSSTTSMKKKMKSSSSKKTSDSSGSSSKALFDKTCATVSQLSLHSSSSGGGTSVANLNNNNNMASAASEVFPSYSQPPVSGIAQPMIAVTSSQQQPPSLAQPGPSFMAPYHQPQYYHHHHHHQYHSGQNAPPPVLPLGPSQSLPPQSLPAPPPPQNYLSYPQPGYNQHSYDVPGSSTSGHPAQYAPPGAGVYHHPYQHPVPQITPRPLQPIPIHSTQNSQNYPPISGSLNSSATTRHPEPTLSGKMNTSVVTPKKTESKSEIVEMKMETELLKTEVKTEFGDNRPDNNEIMQQQKVEKVDNLSDQEIRINGNGTGSGGELTTFGINGNSSIECTKEENKEQTAEKPGNNFKEIKKPMFVVRPAPLDGDVSDDTEEEEEEDDSSEESENENDDEDGDEDTATKQPKQSTIDRQRRKVRRRKISHALKRFNRTFSENLAMEKDVILPVLCRLKSRSDLLSCMAVCQSWNEWCCDPSLWKSLSLTQSKINSVILIGIVRRQPRFLDLSWCKLSKRQLFWLICRLPHLQSLKLAGVGSQVITALHSCHCPRLSTLDLSWSESLSDDLIRCLLSKAPDSRPGLLETKSRLRFMSEFSLAGTLITDDTLRLIVQNLSFIEKLDLSECEMITDSGISGLMIGATNLVELNLAGCRRISDTSLKLFQTSRTLRWFDVRHCQLVTVKACERFLAQTAKSSSSSTTSLVNNRNAHQHQGGGTWKMIEEKLFSKQQPK